MELCPVPPHTNFWDNSYIPSKLATAGIRGIIERF